MKKVVVFSGAGISAESGLKTFRDSDGLWENYNVMDVATPEAWKNNPRLVLDFYNLRREQVLKSEPNSAHEALIRLEDKYDVTIITQNIDDLHERAGSKNVLHLHGEILKSRSTRDYSKTYLIDGPDLNLGDKCEYGSQLRPHVVWFGEGVPKMQEAFKICSRADVFIIVGTSLNVYPAAGLVDYVRDECDKYLIDPQDVYTSGVQNLSFIKEKASTGVPVLVDKLLND